MTVLIRLLVVLLLLVSACSPSSTERPRYDLRNQALISDLGTPLPDQIDWERTIGEVRVIGSATRPDPFELELLAAALAEVPQALAEVAQPRAVIRVPNVESYDPTHADARAFTIGPDIYLIDGSFGEGRRFDLARVYLHELTHVAQFRTLTDDYVQAVLAGEVPHVDPSTGSGLVREFAAATGWSDASENPLQASWRLSSVSTPSSAYGAVDPAEDMAEAVAIAAMGRADWISRERTRWVERWLGADSVTLGAGKPWAPVGTVEVLSAGAIYDEEEVKRLSTRYSHVEPLYFELPASVATHRQLATMIEGELGRRGVSGVLQRADDDRLPRYQGLFSRTDGVGFWVELWDFREADGFDGAPQGPVLTYVILW